MNDISYIKEETYYLFNYNFDDESIPEEVEDSYYDRATRLIDNYSWEDIFNCWFGYLKENCKTPEEVINWANLFYWYGGSNHPISNPYNFLGYLYYKVDMDKYAEVAQTVFDGISIDILSNLGKINTLDNPDYIPETDPNIVAEIENWRKNM